MIILLLYKIARNFSTNTEVTKSDENMSSLDILAEKVDPCGSDIIISNDFCIIHISELKNQINGNQNNISNGLEKKEEYSGILVQTEETMYISQNVVTIL